MDVDLTKMNKYEGFLFVSIFNDFKFKPFNVYNEEEYNYTNSILKCYINLHNGLQQELLNALCIFYIHF